MSRNKNRLTATEVARNFSEVLNRVSYKQEAIVVERGGLPVCEIRPVYQAPRFTGADLANLMRSLVSPGEAYLRAVEKAIRNQPAAEDTKWPR